MHVETTYQPTNRERKFVPKSFKHWCKCCDSKQIGDGQKCPNCRCHDKTRTLKKFYLPTI